VAISVGNKEFLLNSEYGNLLNKFEYKYTLLQRRYHLDVTSGNTLWKWLRIVSSDEFMYFQRSTRGLCWYSVNL